MKHLALILILSVFVSSYGCSQNSSKKLFDQYEKYKAKNFTHRRFKHKDIVHFLQKKENSLNIQTAGYSVEGRSIHKITIGNGPTKVLLWSQMHGNEPTATLAILDILNFFTVSDEFDPLRKAIKKNLTLVFIPMLNPDGTEKFKRRNALDFDLNRDAARVQTPEAFILKNTRDQLAPEWGFNLHDQSRYYSAGHSDKLATITFLAPAYNFEKDINEGRANAMKLIGLLTSALEQFIPGQIGKYNDDFEPRAFGDNIQKWGTNTILIESGGQKGDREKQSIRRLNFVTLMTAFEAIANKSYKKTNIDKYQQIPFNRSNAFHDLLIREAFIPNGNEWVKSDIAFRLKEKQNAPSDRKFWLQAYISDLGDLSTFHGYQELQANGLYCHKGHFAPDLIVNERRFLQLNINQLWQNGITDLMVVKSIFKKYKHKQLPFSLHPIDQSSDEQILMGKNPSLLLKNKDRISYVIVNGQLFETSKKYGSINDFLSKNKQ